MKTPIFCLQNELIEKILTEKKILNKGSIILRKPEEIKLSLLDKIKPDFIFFPHWNWKVPKDIFLKYNCILFHTSDLPKGRGGSPIQNLIINNKKTSPVCAIQMIEEIDAGPEYGRKNISLEGNITEIFDRIQLAIDHLICIILKKKKKSITSKRQDYLF